ncbi:hypothetical protein BT63DRAFT_450978 [Microthyrium microscopicum]|uniref:Uncharacterized protein n=1 Tax=Microthyrium microscopicum TaxID=703497 RepID=A0A6A6UN76_9PEZI|nr:hypothetical protein BT63DRAFT_450978 [Microthyrium microscopicum]
MATPRSMVRDTYVQLVLRTLFHPQQLLFEGESGLEPHFANIYNMVDAFIDEETVLHRETSEVRAPSLDPASQDSIAASYTGIAKDYIPVEQPQMGLQLYNDQTFQSSQPNVSNSSRMPSEAVSRIATASSSMQSLNAMTDITTASFMDTAPADQMSIPQFQGLPYNTLAASSTAVGPLSFQNITPRSMARRHRPHNREATSSGSQTTRSQLRLINALPTQLPEQAVVGEHVSPENVDTATWDTCSSFKLRFSNSLIQMPDGTIREIQCPICGGNGRHTSKKVNWVQGLKGLMEHIRLSEFPNQKDPTEPRDLTLRPYPKNRNSRGLNRRSTLRSQSQIQERKSLKAAMRSQALRPSDVTNALDGATID